MIVFHSQLTQWKISLNHMSKDLVSVASSNIFPNRIEKLIQKTKTQRNKYEIMKLSLTQFWVSNWKNAGQKCMKQSRYYLGRLKRCKQSFRKTHLKNSENLWKNSKVLVQQGTVKITETFRHSLYDLTKDQTKHNLFWERRQNSKVGSKKVWQSKMGIWKRKYREKIKVKFNCPSTWKQGKNGLYRNLA